MAVALLLDSTNLEQTSLPSLLHTGTIYLIAF